MKPQQFSMNPQLFRMAGWEAPGTQTETLYAAILDCGDGSSVPLDVKESVGTLSWHGASADDIRRAHGGGDVHIRRRRVTITVSEWEDA